MQTYFPSSSRRIFSILSSPEIGIDKRGTCVNVLSISPRSPYAVYKLVQDIRHTKPTTTRRFIKYINDSRWSITVRNIYTYIYYCYIVNRSETKPTDGEIVSESESLNSYYDCITLRYNCPTLVILIRSI